MSKRSARSGVAMLLGCAALVRVRERSCAASTANIASTARRNNHGHVTAINPRETEIPLSGMSLARKPSVNMTVACAASIANIASTARRKNHKHATATAPF